MDLRQFTGDLFRPWRNDPSSSKAPAHLALGEFGETAASEFLRSKKHFRILRRNFRALQRGGEIDIVCRDAEVLVFVEVKTRSNEDFGRPAAAVDRKKRRQIIRGAMSWLRMLDMPDIAFRFDVVEVIGKAGNFEIRHIENAFNLPDPYRY